MCFDREHCLWCTPELLHIVLSFWGTAPFPLLSRGFWEQRHVTCVRLTPVDPVRALPYVLRRFPGLQTLGLHRCGLPLDRALQAFAQCTPGPAQPLGLILHPRAVGTSEEAQGLYHRLCTLHAQGRVSEVMLKAMAITMYLFSGLRIPDPIHPAAAAEGPGSSLIDPGTFADDPRTWEDVQVANLVLVPPHHILTASRALHHVQKKGVPAAPLPFLLSYILVRYPDSTELEPLARNLQLAPHRRLLADGLRMRTKGCIATPESLFVGQAWEVGVEYVGKGCDMDLPEFLRLLASLRCESSWLQAVDLQVMVDPSADWKRALPSTHRLLEHYRLMLRLLQTSPPLNPHEPRREPTPADHVATWLRTAMQTLCPMMPAPSKASLLPVAEAALRGMPAVSDAALRPYWARLERYWAQTEAEGHLCKRLLGLQAWDPVEDVQRQYRTWFEHYEELNVRCDRVTLPLYQILIQFTYHSLWEDSVRAQLRDQEHLEWRSLWGKRPLPMDEDVEMDDDDDEGVDLLYDGSDCGTEESAPGPAPGHCEDLRNCSCAWCVAFDADLRPLTPAGDAER